MTTSAMIALATGLPTIATRHSGFPEQIVDGMNGYLADEGDPKSIAAAILKYIDEADKWPAMGRFARQHVLENYDQKILIDRQLAYYQNVINA